MTTCELSKSETPQVYVLRIPKSDPKVMKRFLEQYHPNDSDSKKILRRFLTDTEDKQEISLTFDQEVAFKDKQLSFVNIYHPIIRAGVNLFDAKKDKAKCTFFFQLNSQRLPPVITEGLYMLAIYKITVKRTLFDKPITTDSLYPILFDVTKRCIIQQDIAERFMGRAQVDGQYAPFEQSCKLDEEMIADLRYDLSDCVTEYITEYQRVMQNRIDNSKKLRYQQTIQYYDTRKKSYERNIANNEIQREFAISIGDDTEQRRVENILRLQRAHLRDLMEKRDSDIERINRDVNLKVTSTIKSLNLVQVV